MKGTVLIKFDDDTRKLRFLQEITFESHVWDINLLHYNLYMLLEILVGRKGAHVIMHLMAIYRRELNESKFINCIAIYYYSY